MAETAETHNTCEVNFFFINFLMFFSDMCVKLRWLLIEWVGAMLELNFRK